MKKNSIALTCIGIVTIMNSFLIISINDDIRNEKVVKIESSIVEEKETSSLAQNELKNCPFCNGKADYNFITNNDIISNEKYTSVWIECNECKIETDYFMDNNLEDAKIKATRYWNRGE